MSLRLEQGKEVVRWMQLDEGACWRGVMGLNEDSCGLGDAWAPLPSSI